MIESCEIIDITLPQLHADNKTLSFIYACLGPPMELSTSYTTTCIVLEMDTVIAV